jgi:predicted transcriptional regulator of viral defense system
MIERLRKQIPAEEFDYQTLLDSLKEYSRPRDKITDLLRKKVLIRVKKGIYVFGETYARGPFSREVLANMIYGPSYVSLDYALHYYALIPERVEAVTSVTCGRSRRFSTPVGLFVYRRIPIEAYQIGMDRVDIERGRSFLMATPEKALADKIVEDRGTGIRTQEEMRSYLLDHLRIDPEGLRKLESDRLAAFAERYRSRKIQKLAEVVRRQFRSSAGGHDE